MKNQTTSHLMPSDRPKMSLLALLFFMLGSVDLYGRIQSIQQTPSTSQMSIAPLLKLILLGVTAAGMLEIGHFLI